MGVRLTKPDKKGKRYVVVQHAGKRESFCLGKIDARTGNKRVRAVQKELALGLYKWKTDDDAMVTKYPTFQFFAKDFLEMNKAILKHSTWTGYRNLIERYLLPEWTDYILKEIDKQDVKKLLLKAQAGGLNINNLRICCSALFQWGVETNVLPTNPSRDLGKQFRNGSVAKAVMQVLDKEQIRLFLETIPKEWHCFCLLLFRTGCRLGEAIGVAWEDVDFRTKKICIRRAFTHGQWTTPKSGRTRYVDMTAQLVEALKKRQAKAKPVPIRIDKEVVSLVFVSSGGQPINDKMLRKAFKATLKKCKLPETFRVHDCRHCFASLLLMKGLPVLYVQQQLGHRSAKTTLDKYSHFVPAENSHTTNVLDD